MSERVCEREIEQKKRKGYERRRERERDERRGEERREEERGRERGEERRERDRERERERERDTTRNSGTKRTTQCCGRLLFPERTTVFWHTLVRLPSLTICTSRRFESCLTGSGAPLLQAAMPRRSLR